MQAAQILRRSLRLFGLLALMAAPAAAVTVTGLYSVEVPVASSQPEDLEQGYAAGLSRVFVRVSGTRDVLDNEGVDALLSNAESLLQSYQFLRSDENNHRLRMSFGAVGVNRALASVDAPVWGANRPLTLAWIAVEESGRRTLVHADGEIGGANGQWRQILQGAAVDRGLPVTLPPEEFGQDRELLSDIWGQFTSSVRSASEELEHDLVSLVRISRSGSQWRAGWVFDGMGLDSTEQSVTADTREELAARLIGRWAEMFADRYAVAGSDVGESPQVDIVVHGITSLTDYASVNRVLKNLSPVVEAGATQAREDQLKLRLVFSGEMEQLKQYIALAPRLVPLSDAEVSRIPVRDSTDPGDRSDSAEGDSDESILPTPEGGVALAEDNAENSSATANPLFVYQPLLVDEQESEQAFESLYQVLHYRWQPASIINPENGE
ncbi:DUF2066 domain-containing protein [Marinobacter orientalis]|uniref:DUF2066 domain-containing protein n=1 Tax=Marinobacter orientalis TaxID=1928859 RepID=A0A7Y0RFM7_9GAMM|nr:DUF2066 domain-containing protein [Marinobacter orientalis]NMT65377.1 DUF2066 domain-containing protein [Marinobacter orientalis]TGX47609.1 DUF2066 domain-containing protein [Marinobacter orientalis]